MKLLIPPSFGQRLFACIVLFFPLPTFASSLITLSPSGDGSFLLQGVGIEGAAAFDIALGYDAASLGNPRVVAGSFIAGAMMEANTNIPGTVRIAIIRTAPVTGSGIIATLTFDRKGESVGKITALNVKLANTNGAPLLAMTQINNSLEPPVSMAKSPSPFTSSVIIGGDALQSNKSNVTSELSQTIDQYTQPVQPRISDEPVQVSPAETRKTDSSLEEGKIDTQKSVLDRFKNYHGERTIKALSALFAQDSMIVCRQTPLIALSDGKSVVTVVLKLASGGEEFPHVVVTRARLVSWEKEPDKVNERVINLIPEKGSYRASISFLQGKRNIECPLTVAPKVNIDFDKSGSVTEADSSLYFKKRGTRKAPKFDLNNDGKRDYIDDYIFTANYFAIRDAVNARIANKSTVSTKQPTYLQRYP